MCVCFWSRNRPLATFGRHFKKITPICPPNPRVTWLRSVLLGCQYKKAQITWIKQGYHDASYLLGIIHDYIYPISGIHPGGINLVSCYFWPIPPSPRWHLECPSLCAFHDRGRTHKSIAPGIQNNLRWPSWRSSRFMGSGYRHGGKKQQHDVFNFCHIWSKHEVKELKF